MCWCSILTIYKEQAGNTWYFVVERKAKNISELVGNRVGKIQSLGDSFASEGAQVSAVTTVFGNTKNYFWFINPKGACVFVLATKTAWKL